MLRLCSTLDHPSRFKPVIACGYHYLQYACLNLSEFYASKNQSAFKSLVVCVLPKTNFRPVECVSIQMLSANRLMRYFSNYGTTESFDMETFKNWFLQHPNIYLQSCAQQDLLHILNRTQDEWRLLTNDSSATRDVLKFLSQYGCWSIPNCIVIPFEFSASLDLRRLDKACGKHKRLSSWLC